MPNRRQATTTRDSPRARSNRSASVATVNEFDEEHIELWLQRGLWKLTIACAKLWAVGLINLAIASSTHWVPWLLRSVAE